MATITLCMIVRDVADIVTNAIASVAPYVHEAIIVDTGSVDDTKQVCSTALKNLPHKILDYNAVTHPKSFMSDSPALESWGVPGPFSGEMILADFGAARQFGWAHATSDFCVWIDADDTLVGGEHLADVARTLDEQKLDAAFFNYEYDHDANGRVICRLLRERLVRRVSTAHWEHPIHELLVPVDRNKTFDQCKVVHRHDRFTRPTKIAHRNLKVLLKQYHQDKNDSRTLFYLGTTLMGSDPARGLKFLQEYLELPSWDEERGLAYVWIGRYLEGRGQFIEAFQHFAAATAEFPGNPDGLFGCARSYYERALRAEANGKPDGVLWSKAVELFGRGFETLRNPGPRHAYMQYNPIEREIGQLPFFMKSLIEIGARDHAVAVGKQLLALDPSGPHAANTQYNLEVLEKASKPATTKPAETSVVGAPKRTLVLWTGPAYENWSPKSLDTTGIGGSETAAVHMAREFAQLGWDVTVINECGPQAGVYDGVRYVDYRNRSEVGVPDVFVCSRQANVLAHMHGKLNVLWVHDVHVGEPVSDTRVGLERADIIFALSNWHKENLKQCYPFIPDRKIVVTRNGLDLSRFSAPPAKQGNRVIYSSSPDRGLESLLALWGRVRARVPDAELHVYYGFLNWSKDPSSETQARIARIKNSLASTPGVFAHERVGQHELAEAFLASKVWAYPTWFTETSCITAMEAQAAGAVPITSAIAALPETVKHGFLLQGDGTADLYRDAFVDLVVEMLRDEQSRLQYAIPAREWALANLSWRGVAEQWQTLFTAQPRIEVGARKLKIAGRFGLFSSQIHGKFDIKNLFHGRGLTGSESCYFNTLRGLAELGHEVDGFCDTIHDDPIQYGGALFHNFSQGTGKDYDVYMSWNEPDPLRVAPPNKLRVCVQQLNDFSSYSTPGFDSWVDLYVMPADTHRKYLIGAEPITPGKTRVIPNSVNLELLDGLPTRASNTKSIVWCSSPDRGLHVLLDLFPEIRRQVPDATLDIYYRFRPWYENVHATVNEVGARARSIMARLEQPGVRLRDAVSNRDVYAALAQARLLAYTCEPVSFTEGFSVSTMDAALTGCIPVISDADALPEIYSNAAVIIHGKPSNRRQVWIDTIVSLLTDNHEAAALSQRAHKFAREFDRRTVALRWQELLLSSV